MNNWKSYVNSESLEWLLEENNPSVRYFTLKNILGKSEGDLKVKEARKNIMKIGTVPKILAKQENEGYWGRPENYYLRSKYRGTSWQMIVLAELRADENNIKIKKTCEFILKTAQDPESGAFSYLSDKNGTGDHEKVLPCFTANMIWCLIRFGYLDDERLQNAIGWLIKYQRFDDGDGAPPDIWPFKRWERCWGKHTCHSIIVKSLKAFSEIPKNKRNSEINQYIEKGSEFLLKHHIYKRSHDLSMVGNEKWINLGFPLMWDFDIAEILLILLKLGFKDDRMQEAIDIIVSKQGDDGKWIMDRTFNGRLLTSIERKSKPSKWITLNALSVLKGYYG
jgi:hypothetical protein